MRCELVFSRIFFPIIFFLAVFSAEVLGETYPGFIEVTRDSSEAFDLRLLSAQKNALLYLDRYSKNPISNPASDPKVKEFIETAWRALSAVTFEKVTLEHAEKTACKTSTDETKTLSPNFYTPKKDMVVVCKPSEALSDGELVQMLVHESAHLAERTLSPSGEAEPHTESESQAVELEYAVIRNNTSSRCVFVVSSYDNEEFFPDIYKMLRKDGVTTPTLCPN